MNRIRYCLASTGLVAVMAMAMVPGTASAGQKGKSPVKVFILAGQSNMEGTGATKIPANSRNKGKGTLELMDK